MMFLKKIDAIFAILIFEKRFKLHINPINVPFQSDIEIPCITNVTKFTYLVVNLSFSHIPSCLNLSSID